MNKQDELSTYWLPIVTSFYQGKTALPVAMGLSESQLAGLQASFHDAGIPFPAPSAKDTRKAEIYQQLIVLRQDELQELKALLVPYSQHSLAPLMVNVISSASMGPDHLWSDLGLPERPVLSALIGYYFPDLHNKNDKNMRWKRFFYKQLCEQGGDYICKAPNCADCVSYSECFIDSDKRQA